jgi:hypothetical protein
MANSSFTTYFGKPAFHNYGNANTKPTTPGFLCGSYLYSHSIGPHLRNKPEFRQVYKTAEKKASTREVPVKPRPPRKCKDEDRLAPS